MNIKGNKKYGRELRVSFEIRGSDRRVYRRSVRARLKADLFGETKAIDAELAWDRNLAAPQEVPSSNLAAPQVLSLKQVAKCKGRKAFWAQAANVEAFLIASCG